MGPTIFHSRVGTLFMYKKTISPQRNVVYSLSISQMEFHHHPCFARHRFQWYQFAWRPPQRSESSPVRIVEQRSDPKQVESGNKASKPSTGAWLLCARAKAIKTQTQSHKSYFCLYALSHTETCIHMREATKFARFSTGLH